MSKPPPASLVRAGLSTIQHKLPAGFAVDFHADFVRIFKEDIQRKGQAQPMPAPRGER